VQLAVGSGSGELTGCGKKSQGTARPGLETFCYERYLFHGKPALSLSLDSSGKGYFCRFERLTI
jgi:hypothetical protein